MSRLHRGRALLRAELASAAAPTGGSLANVNPLDERIEAS
jgi:hypothetical protein